MPHIFFCVKTRNVLIASASAGTGHTRAAQALHSTLLRYQPTWNVEHVDILQLAPRLVRAAYGGGFELIASKAPRVWRSLYRIADGPDVDRARWAGATRRVLFREFDALLSATRWDEVVCTHFLPAQLAAGRRAHLPPFSIVVTDFTLHRYWVQPRVHRYYVANATLANEVRERLPHADVNAAGIPIDPRFASSLDAAAARERLALPIGSRVLLVLGGGLGIGVEAAARDCLLAAPPDVQIVVICGRNDTARHNLGQLGIPAHRLRIEGYVSDMELYYAAADLIVTKPGGLTCSEVLAMGRPAVLTRPIPGHEEGNVAYLCGRGAALSAATSAELHTAIAQIFGDAADLSLMAQRARLEGRGESTVAIMRDLEQRLLARAVA